ncbi:hypothetical protein [Pseudodesulfovibrio piezophilus]|uniref:Lipoprotein n=1 Tax=Pseudodesulfovibrio piezophilus (strain DSM 21447 / JCM 15486 / C1TLV30) TaxID=1322246 RepID=M1WQV7_PSEP2|nr:hypothetical protein [Pseudodesulfovibrio piezophilus]CCH49209.1 exported protein of unknown function [Pseudodesulfovibrio piezophilus C1TLV30]
MKIWNKIALTGCLLAMMLPAFGCSEEGPAEKAGKKVDHAVEEAKDAMDTEGPAEEAGKKVDQIVEDAKEQMKKVGE